jgi:hypothetical protein
MITAAPARMCGLQDRGRLAPGLRADLVRLREHDGTPVIREVWRQGRAGRLMRAALYWAPALDDPLHDAGSAWLGRDAETNAPSRQPAIPGIEELTAEPRLYGLHATLKPPFHIATSYPRLREEAQRLAAGLTPFVLPALEVHNYKNFLALREVARARRCMPWPTRWCVASTPTASRPTRRRWRGAGQTACARRSSPCCNAGATPTCWRSGSSTSR